MSTRKQRLRVRGLIKRLTFSADRDALIAVADELDGLVGRATGAAGTTPEQREILRGGTNNPDEEYEAALLAMMDERDELAERVAEHAGCRCWPDCRCP